MVVLTEIYVWLTTHWLARKNGAPPFSRPPPVGRGQKCRMPAVSVRVQGASTESASIDTSR